MDDLMFSADLIFSGQLAGQTQLEKALAANGFLLRSGEVIVTRGAGQTLRPAP